MDKKTLIFTKDKTNGFIKEDKGRKTELRIKTYFIDYIVFVYHRVNILF